MKRILNCVVCYDNHKEILSYAEKLSKLNKSDLLVLIITINKLSDENLRYLESKLEKIDLNSYIYSLNKNVGYMNGMIYGVKEYFRINPNIAYEYVLFTNTDISFPDRNFVSILAEKKYDTNYWVIGPAIFVPIKQSYSNPICDNRRSLKTIKRLIYIFRTPFINTLYFLLSRLKSKLKKIKIESSREVYEVHGSFMILKSELIPKLIEKPFNAILYSEETYIAENVYLFGKKAFYDTELVVNHLEHSVTQFINIRKTNKYIATSLKVIRDDFYINKVGEK